GGLTTIYAGPLAGAAVYGGTSTLIGEGLEKLTGTNDRSFSEIAQDTAVNTVISTAFAGGIKLLAKPISKVVKNVGNKVKPEITSDLNPSIKPNNPAKPNGPAKTKTNQPTHQRSLCLQVSQPHQGNPHQGSLHLQVSR
ncbi:MAG: hypothetical protein FWG14_14335, partial [Peptococcaceae bacterium]|nr:hypothetical protein [Peptococcaceae bacterium]